MTFHLAHLNTALLLKPLDHPDSAGFYNNFFFRKVFSSPIEII